MTDQHDEHTQEAPSPVASDASGGGLRLGLTPPGPPFGTIGVVALLVAIAFSRIMGKTLMSRVRTAHASMLVCVGVPDRSWFEPLREAAKAMIRVPTVHVFDSTTRRTIGDPSITEVVRDVSKGRCVLCVSQDISAAIPQSLRTVADASISLAGPTAADIGVAIGIVRGVRRLSRVPPGFGSGLDIHEVAACLRGGETTRAMVERILKATSAKAGVGVDLTAPRLEDLHGYGEAAAWGRRVVADVVAFRAGKLTWHDVSGAAILHGPPGTGKTLFSRAMARSLDAPLVATSVSSWFQTGSGDLGATVRTASSVFDQARTAVRENGVAVLFLDEVDSLPDRAALDARTGSWWRPVVNYILTSVDGAVSDLRGIVLLGATNDLAAVDAALLRPGRFGTVLQVLPPSVEDLAGVLRHHLGGDACPIPASEIVAVLRPLAGATQARAAAWAIEAMRSARDAGRPVRIADLVAVALPADRRSLQARRRIAVHEAGHAVAAWRLARDRLVSVSIVETAGTHGSTTMLVRDDALLLRGEIEDEVVLALSGRASDVVVGGGANAGAGGGMHGGVSSDLSIATDMLTAVHTSYGLGLTLRHRRHVGLSHDAEVARLVEADLQRLMARAEAMMSTHAAEVYAVTEALIERGFLSANDVGALIATADAASRPPVGEGASPPCRASQKADSLRLLRPLCGRSEV